MPKQGELDYLRIAGPETAESAERKPFSEPSCGRYLIDIGSVFTLLPPVPAAVLDLGVGTGWTSILYAKRGYAVTGQDIAPDMIALAERARIDEGLPNLRFLACDYEELRLPGAFDAAVFYDSLHHSVDEVAALRCVYAALKPGGICVTVEPGEGHAAAPESIEAMRRFGVTERDMPPAAVIAAGRAVGFRGAKVYARSYGPPLLLDADHLPQPPTPQRRPSRGRRFLSGVKRSLTALLPDPPDPPPRPQAEPDFLRQSNIVMLTK